MQSARCPRVRPPVLQRRAAQHGFFARAVSRERASHRNLNMLIERLSMQPRAEQSPLGAEAHSESVVDLVSE
ncbi:hypothetical protein GCM10010129_06440 [Streptomyces fumigatiscleroticus]|nr:hypothetical protein GCM10010129_06440 [Streptomyces fumigatiscleroticus]